MDLLLGFHHGGKGRRDVSGSDGHEEEPVDLDVWTVDVGSMRGLLARRPSTRPLSPTIGPKQESPRDSDDGTAAAPRSRTVHPRHGPSPSALAGSGDVDSEADLGDGEGLGAGSVEFTCGWEGGDHPGGRHAGAEAIGRASSKGSVVDGVERSQGEEVGDDEGASEGVNPVGAVVERFAGGTLAELRMAGPYSTLTLLVSQEDLGVCAHWQR